MGTFGKYQSYYNLIYKTKRRPLLGLIISTLFEAHI
jgi:hypothetical protein